MSLIWQWFAFFTVLVFPIYDGRHAIARAVRGMLEETRRS
jgi:urea-proton symporter